MIFMARCVGETTCVGFNADKYPAEHGNCFSVENVTDGKGFKILNFIHENLAELMREGLTWPVRCQSLSDRHAVIHDERIPDSFYERWFCEVCCPVDLLPSPQLLRRERWIATGYLVVRDGYNRFDTRITPKIGKYR